ncbi:MAG TPA: hypothetical protein DCE56_12880 [Cyanobacteria bacterium UBA8553]|nr:hypothetical protein [Cyanobacteria bacterium UBA8553]
MPANFQLDELENQFEEKSYNTQVVRLYLPYFKDIKPEEVIHIRHKEKRLYGELEERLGRLLNGYNDLDNEETLLNELHEIDQHIQQLTEKFEAMKEALHRSDIYVIIGFVGVGLVPLLPPSSILSQLAMSIGGAGLWDYFKLKIEEAARVKSLKEDEYYLLWRLNSKFKKLWF